MKQRFPVILALLVCVSTTLFADSYWVAFTDKKGTVGDINHPETFLSERAIERRTRQNIAIDSLDLPVSHIYLDSLATMGAEVLMVSRWLNGATIHTSDNALVKKLKNLAFIDSLQRTQLDNISYSTHKKLPTIYLDDPLSYGSAKTQTEMLQLQKLHEAGFRGDGMYIAVIDNGFYNVDKSAYFDRVRERITCTRNFVNPATDVYAVGGHGSSVLSCMAAYSENKYCGTAIDAAYCLIVTEDDDTESLREIDAQVAGFEFADSIGADIITSSLGYFAYFDDPTSDIPYAAHDGYTIRNSRAANIAARKGMVVCIAAGNEGDISWHYISSPADADSILAVGSVTSSREKSSFSSFGPTADGRIKPDVCAMGSNTSLYNPNNNTITTSNGTSYATPIMAGAVACLWQALPELSNIRIIQRILHTASLSDSPNNSIGYGIPDMWSAYLGEKTSIQETTNDPVATTTATFTLQGQPVGNDRKNLPSGIYIQREGNQVTKIIVP